MQSYQIPTKTTERDIIQYQNYLQNTEKTWIEYPAMQDQK